MNKQNACPRCGNTEIGPEHNYCIICGLQLKENAPADSAKSMAEAQLNHQVQDTPEKGDCQ